MNISKFILFTFLSFATVFGQTTDKKQILHNIKIGGLLQVYGENDHTSSVYSSFYLRRMELAVSGNIYSEKITFKAMIDPVSKSADIDESGNKNHIVNVAQDLFITFSLSNYLNIKLGQFLYPLTSEGLKPSEFLYFSERTLVGSIAGDKRDIGIELSGSASFINYSVAVINGNGANTKDNNNNKDVVTRVVFKPVEGLQFGGSGYFGEATENDIDQDKERYCAEFEYKTNQWSLTSEYAKIKDGPLESETYYGMATYNVTKQIVLALRYEDWEDNFAEDFSIYSFGGGYYLFDNSLKFMIDFNHKKIKDDDSENKIILGAQILF